MHQAARAQPGRSDVIRPQASFSVSSVISVASLSLGVDNRRVAQPQRQRLTLTIAL
jgi:hypothetical protein